MAKEPKAKLDELLDSLLEGRKPEEILGNEGLLAELTKRLVERALEAEMTAHLSYEKHAPAGRNLKNSRNGRVVKRVKMDTADIELEVPRDREGCFEPQLVPKRRRRLAGFGFPDAIAAVYPKAQVQLCIVHMVRNSLRYVSWKHRKADGPPPCTTSPWSFQGGCRCDGSGQLS